MVTFEPVVEGTFWSKLRDLLIVAYINIVVITADGQPDLVVVF